ncbi:MAG: hypothetical protein NC818_03765 [Candidatus Omnitrophica bacterium]|nr:hypothetical protein [Candidatus Omnitrophota bacterium]
MAEDIQSLLKKIQEEGIKEAEEKATAIEREAKRRAEEILKSAREEAEKLIKEAKAKILQEEAYTKTLLQQASRDTLLVIKKEINTLLQKIILLEIREIFKPEELSRIISTLVKEYKGDPTQEITVLLKREDADNIRNHYLNKLKEEVKRGILVKQSDELTGGFLISYDGGKSYFDFSDRALAEYIGNYLKPRLKDLLSDVVKES